MKPGMWCWSREGRLDIQSISLDVLASLREWRKYLDAGYLFDDGAMKFDDRKLHVNRVRGEMDTRWGNKRATAVHRTARMSSRLS